MLISKFGATDVLKKLDIYETVIGKKIPDQLRKFLEQYNGGETPNTSFKCNNISSDLKALYGLGNVKYSMDAVKPVELKDNIYLPFGCDSFGNEIAMNLNTGSVVFLNHENGAVKLLTSDLRSFLNICDSKPLNPASIKSVEERERELIQKGRGYIITDALREMWKTEIKKYASIKQEEVSI